MLAVLDTNILVSAIWSKNSNPGKLLDLAVAKRITLCYDSRMMEEYRSVLYRPRLRFSEVEVFELLDFIEAKGLVVAPEPLAVPFTDESDRKFYEAAKACGAILVTGNLKHYPAEPGIVSPAGFLQLL